MNTKEYYDKYIKKDDEGECSECGKETKFRGQIKGYRPFCSAKCSKHSKIVSEKISKSFNHRDVKEEANKRRLTVENRYGVSCVSKLQSSKDKVKKTCLDKYGYETNLLTEECHDKRWKSLIDNMEEINIKRKEFWTESNIEKVNATRKKTLMELYGVDSAVKIDGVKEKIRATNESTGKWLSQDEYSEYKKYSYKVRNISRLLYDELYKTWNGYDYYTGELLVDNIEYLKSHPKKHVSSNLLQPTVDHKISIVYGFRNGISAEDIAQIGNMCICGRGINITKNFKCEEEFLELLRIGNG
tara:strand:- start:9802 stop:10701 length:900 start_codon:yes stop_codon:yes gene_type:complete